MPPELFLHIGTTKTGSTSIQHTFDAHRRALREQGAYWPVTSGGTKRHQLLAASHATPKKHQRGGASFLQGMEPKARMEAYREEFVREITRLPKKFDRVIMSAEQFSVALRTHEEIKHLHDYLAPLFSKMTIIVYLRRQDSHYSSLFAQHLRVGNLYEPDLSRVKIGFMHDYDYHDLVMRWAEVFGRDNVRPRIFERTAANAFDVVQDFSALCRVTLEIDPDDGKSARNPSMSALGQQVMIKAGALLERMNDGKPHGFLWNRLSESVTRVYRGEGWRPTQDEARAFQARFEESNEALRTRWFPDRPSLFSTDYSKLPLRREPPDPAAAFEAACTVLLDAIGAGVAREEALSLEIAKLADAEGDPKRAVSALMRLLRVDPRNIDTRMQLVEQHIKLGDLPAAAATFKAARRVAPDNPLLGPVAEKLGELGAVITPDPVQAPQAKPREKRGKAVAERRRAIRPPGDGA